MEKPVRLPLDRRFRREGVPAGEMRFPRLSKADQRLNKEWMAERQRAKFDRLTGQVRKPGLMLCDVQRCNRVIDSRLRDAILVHGEADSGLLLVLVGGSHQRIEEYLSRRH
jgi:hypothetical protein